MPSGDFGRTYREIVNGRTSGTIVTSSSNIYEDPHA